MHRSDSYVQTKQKAELSPATLDEQSHDPNDASETVTPEKSAAGIKRQPAQLPLRENKMLCGVRGTLRSVTYN